ncbi:hypothetical protein [Massilia yuzhufengensis]|uniref:Uncharacterized protein n=1 Tax=Massilia yuzhufengensis TaxID=1164594 RepID=A0A1I1Q9V2_9BURK|nr:hypothetical protein [Massilia yuzhufengensis]SFD18914.1 hypothetical protein SAMN05216204_11894 [Massilia yuzhufengensis]
MNIRETANAVTRAVEWEFAHSTYAQVLADVPGALFPYWVATAHHEFPGIPRDASFYAQSVEGLMMFFDCVAAAGRRCALPSRAADSVWHAWARLDAPGLDRFCIRHFGRGIPHVERAHMQGDMGLALAVCLVQARRRASQPAAGTHLPRLFSLDGQLGMPGGFGYRVIGGLVACSTLDEFGNPEDKLGFPGELAPYALYVSGLVSKDEYDAAALPGGVRERRCVADDGAAIIGAGVYLDIAGTDDDGASGDGAAPPDGGSSWSGSACGGSSCGGGGCGSS